MTRKKPKDGWVALDSGTTGFYNAISYTKWGYYDSEKNAAMFVESRGGRKTSRISSIRITRSRNISQLEKEEILRTHPEYQNYLRSIRADEERNRRYSRMIEENNQRLNKKEKKEKARKTRVSRKYGFK
ncbi:hypothetical protein HN832_04180 [archaeon]|jgi:hypothetical protein|nr:hypothetical protein [archaeon]MBT4373408.1 hypothetical protein [archaeon]MBT4531856.1 hypothetical protein [archaeon]MBT7001523.1 hypothetical protein [archaeon]MBT7282585.1 hypothetical protein [archaeon]